MRLTAIRTLVLTLVLLLPLPQGWCCILPGNASEPIKTALLLHKSACCGHCSKPLQPNAPRRPGVPPAECPCGDRQGMKPDLNKVFSADYFPALATDKDVLAWHMRSREPPAETAITFLELSRHLLLCTWQC
jgi:hypothetical protein